MKKIILIIAVLIFQTQLGKGQTIDDYLIEAAENNPGLKAAYLQFEADMTRVSQVNSLPDPSLSFGYFISPVETRLGPQQVRIGLSQMFPWFGTLSARERVSTAMAEASYQEFLNQRNELHFKVKNLYYLLFEIKQHIKWQKENLEILNTYKALSTTRFSSSQGSMADVIRVQIMQENVQTEIKINQDKWEALNYAFGALLNRKDTISVRIEEGLIDMPFQLVFESDSALAQNPMLRAMDSKINAAEASKTVAKKDGLPKIGVGLDYVFVGNRTDMDVTGNGKNIIMPMVSLSLPIYRKKYKSAIKEAKLNQQMLFAKKEDITNGLMSSYYITKNELEIGQKQNQLYLKQMENTSIAIDLLYSAYANSGKDFEEVLRMQQELLKYRMAQATAIKQIYTAWAKMNYLTANSKM